MISINFNDYDSKNIIKFEKELINNLNDQFLKSFSSDVIEYI